jgi:fluoroacetyl-CoA thioesterase
MPQKHSSQDHLSADRTLYNVKQGLHPGAEATVTVTVTPDMVATFEELGPVHPLYSTWSMVRHMELACRKIILPYLEPGEDAVGHSINVTHLAPTGIGERVTARARLIELDGRRIVCAVEAHNEHERIGEGTQVQMVVRKDRLAALIEQLQRRAGAR